tara:strand:+ start:819 stop:965 length:147 start_codon:yes stop_codon:yes gene_type:complete
MGKSITVNVFYGAGSKVVKIDTILSANFFGGYTIAKALKEKAPKKGAF